MNFATDLFGAKQIAFNEITHLQQGSPNIIIWAAPVMFLFALIEFIASRRENKEYYSRSETIGSILVGIGNVIIGVLLKTALFVVFVWVYNLLPWRMSLQWWTLIPCYIFFDFCSYWTHNISHRNRFFWATHVVHHSSLNYNLTVSFRLSWVQYIKIIFVLPVALMGFHPVIIFFTSQIAVLFQFWVHTEYIRKLHPIIEYIFATPSNHRVHHGSQPKYINKNFGATFILWDRMFNTYQAEEEQADYGITEKMSKKSNPLHINFHEYKNIFRDVRIAKNWRSRLFYIFGDPGKVDKAKHLHSPSHPGAGDIVPDPGE
jgi:sterol desaturase/sphingolipid hydroxylase (fatty acid hydroxylase superfamily)